MTFKNFTIRSHGTLSVLLALVLTLALAGCAQTTGQKLPIREYVMQESKEALKPTVKLEEGGKFTFTYSPLSSYIAVGNYEEADGRLTLNTDDGKYTYMFDISGETLIFDAADSSELPSYANVPDGSVFE